MLQLKKTGSNTYPKEVVDAESQVSTRGESIHHEMAVDIQAKGVGEVQQDITICGFGVWGGDVCIYTIDLLGFALRLS